MKYCVTVGAHLLNGIVYMYLLCANMIIRYTLYRSGIKCHANIEVCCMIMLLFCLSHRKKEALCLYQISTVEEQTDMLRGSP